MGFLVDFTKDLWRSDPGQKNYFRVTIEVRLLLLL
jgi:hypothetical protein